MVRWEHVALSYCAYLSIVAFVTRAPRAAHLASVMSLLSAVVLVTFLPRPDESAIANMVRAWLPLVVLLAGYRVSGLFYAAPMERVERALLQLDDRLLGPAGTTRLIDRLPRALLDVLEFSYLMVYPVIPAGVVTVLLAGTTRDLETFWMLVMTAAFVSYAFLPWLQTRPPRLLEHTRIEAPSALRRLNLAVLRSGSTHVNTIPSGHAAAASAVALAVISVIPAVGIVFVVVASAIAVATIVGRYHYWVDTLAGIAVALLTWLALG